MTIYTREQKRIFENAFQVPIGSFWDAIFGFDIVGFGDWLFQQHPEEEANSIADCLVKCYGEEVSNLIMMLNQIMPLSAYVRGEDSDDED